MAIMVDGAVAIEANSAEKDVGDDLVAKAVDAEDNVAEAEMVVVAVDEEDIMEMKGSTQTLIFTDSQTIST